MSGIGPRRVMNINYFSFLLFLLFSTFYWGGWIARNIPLLDEKKKKPIKIGLVIICFILGCFAASDLNIDTMTSTSAAKSLITGEAKKYHEEYLFRLSLYVDPE